MNSPNYTKAKPKVNDYNPITHTPFYSPSPVPKQLPQSPRQAASNMRSPRETNPFARNSSQRSPLAYSAALSLSPSKNVYMSPAERRAKTKLRSNLFNPITGEKQEFKLQRPNLESLDIIQRKDRLPKKISEEPFPVYNLSNTKSASGSLKRLVPEVSYVNPYGLKYS